MIWVYLAGLAQSFQNKKFATCSEKKSFPQVDSITLGLQRQKYVQSIQNNKFEKSFQYFQENVND